MLSASFDHTARLWDADTGDLVHKLSGHQGEISSVQCNADSSLIVTGSIDRTCKLWDFKTG